MSDTVQLFADAWKVMVGRLPSPHIEEANGVVSCFGNVPLIFLNVSIVIRPAATQDELQSLLQTAAERSKSCTHPSGIIAREDWLPSGWQRPVEEAGLTPLLYMTDMEGAELLPPRRTPAKLDIRRVENDSTARDLAHLNAHAYHMPAELFECISNMRLWRADSYGYVGYVEGKPVSCAAAFPVAGTVYVALVATLPEAQGKGYADSIMRHTVTQAQQAMGTMRTTLHATEMGLPVYRGMGYTTGPRVVFLGQSSQDG